MRVSQQRMSVAVDCNEGLVRDWREQYKKTLDVRKLWKRLLCVLSSHVPPALLYRLRRGENPYDFSRPEVQRNYLYHQINRWS